MTRTISRHRLRPLAAGLALLKCRSGTTAIEFGFVAPAFLLLVLGTIEFGRAYWTWNALTYAVEEAARCASINTVTCGTTAKIEAFAAGRSGAAFSSAIFSATTTGCGNKVSVSYPMTLYIPFANYAVTLTAQSCYPI